MNAAAWVGIAAIVMASIFNALALRRSAKALRQAEESFRKTEEKYRLDRLDSRNDRIREALVELSRTSFAWMQALQSLDRATRAHLDELQSEDVDVARVAKTLEKVVAANFGLLPVIGEVGASFTGLRLLAGGIDELTDPLKVFAAEIEKRQLAISDAFDLDGFAAFADDLEADRRRLSAATQKLIVAGIEIVSRR